MGRHFETKGKRRSLKGGPRLPDGGGHAPLEVEILRWAHGGDGVAYGEAEPHLGKVIFVRGVVPGDRVRVTPEVVKARWIRARLDAVLRPSPQRREPACAYQARCGGCPWMVGSVEAQATSRRLILEGELRKRLGPAAPEPELRPTPRALGYRQRLRMTARAGRLGFIARHSHDFIPVEGCAIAQDAINAALPAIREALSPEVEARVTLLAGQEGVAAWIEPDGPALGPEAVTVTLGGVQQRLRPGAFAQANPEVTAQILADIGALATETASRSGPAPTAVELFAGSGTLTTALWQAGFSVTAYELAEAARPPFQATREAAGISEDRGAWHACDLLATGILTPRPMAPDLVLLDPPRTGAAPLLPWLRVCGARRILYVACDLAAGLRDVANLVNVSGAGPSAWELSRVIAYDMFVHSGHQEVLFVLDRLGG